MKSRREIKLYATIVVVFGAALAAISQPTTSAQWLSDCSVDLREGYDNNVFLSDAATPSSYALPAGSVAALRDRASWITTVAPSFGINFAPFIGGGSNISVLNLKYIPEFNVYHNAPTESYTAHRLAASVKGEEGPLDFSADDNFTFIDGNRVGPFYPGNLYSAFGTTADRERRRQIQDRANVSVQFNMGDFFIRPTASLLYYNLMTDLRDIPGYQNYSDRSDVNGGIDFGYKVTHDLALTIGYRYGHQNQSQFSFSPYSSPNSYQWLLVGIEGKPWPWLQIKFAGGPDFRVYEGDSAGHITPLNDLNPVKYYGEGSVTADVTESGTLVFKYKAWQWVAGIGKVPYYDQGYELSYQQSLLKNLSINLGARVTSWDFSNSNIPGVGRNDLEYMVNVGVDFEINRYWRVGLNYSLNLGRNGQNAVPIPQNREFDDDLVSLSTRLKF